MLPVIEAGQARVVSDADEEVLDGIRFLPTFGHRIGHMAIQIRSRSEAALFSGDAMHSAVQVGRRNSMEFALPHIRVRRTCSQTYKTQIAYLSL